MTIDINELRRLAQAASPGPWFSDRRGNIWRRPLSDLYENGGGVAGDKPLAFVAAGWAGEGVTGYPFEANARLIAAANPATISEILDRLEEAEKERDYCKYGGLELLYALPGAQAQPAPSEQGASVRKAWARFSHELHRSPDAPYPGMSDAFEQHFSQSFTDREWRAEASTWAAAWKAAKRHCAQPAPSVPEGWQLVPTAESRHPGIYKMLGALHAADNTPGMSEWESYRAMLSEAPEAKP